MEDNSSVLFIVSTPIGNMEDITLRALRILREVDFIASEDTRKTRKLLNFYKINTPLVSYIEQGNRRRGEGIIRLLKEGKKIALVTEAGTPGISDPGYDLVRLCISNSIPVVTVPGACAIISALSISGLPTDRFLFLGFLPNRKIGRRKALEEVSQEKRTLVIFESPRRINQLLRDILDVMGDRRAAICREMTKAFEDVMRGTVSKLLEIVEREKIKGEITLVIEGFQENKSSFHREIQKYRKRINFLRERCGLSDRDIIKVISEEERVPKKFLYKLLVEDKSSNRVRIN
jgi:16S rRNA (cytidine1402-2'-O)-methyltransferase